MRKKFIECLSCIKHCSRLWKYKNENQNNNKNLTYFREEREPINKNKEVRKAVKKEMQEEN